MPSEADVNNYLAGGHGFTTTPGPAGGGGHNLLTGLAKGFGRFATGAASGLPVVGQYAKDFGAAYREPGVGAMENIGIYAGEILPWLSPIGRVASGVRWAGELAPSLGRIAETLTSTAARRGALAGGVAGAAQEPGDETSGIASWPGRLGQGLVGAAAGAAIGKILPKTAPEVPPRVPPIPNAPAGPAPPTPPGPAPAAPAAAAEAQPPVNTRIRDVYEHITGTEEVAWAKFKNDIIDSGRVPKFTDLRNQGWSEPDARRILARLERDRIILANRDERGGIRSFRVNPAAERSYIPSTELSNRALEGQPPLPTNAQAARDWLKSQNFQFITPAAIDGASDRQVINIARNQGWPGSGGRPPWEGAQPDPNRPIRPDVIAEMQAAETGAAPPAAAPAVPAAADPRMSGFTSSQINLLSAQVNASPGERSEMTTAVQSLANELRRTNGRPSRSFLERWGIGLASWLARGPAQFWKIHHGINMAIELRNLAWQEYNISLNLPAAAGEIAGRSVS
jgi:hypothetical protein